MNPKRKKYAKKYEFSAPLLQAVGLRPTRQRLALAHWLFDGAHKHVTAEQLHTAVLGMRQHISLATIYNTLNRFKNAGLLRSIAIDGGQVFFDTNTADHHHLFDEAKRYLCDVPENAIRLSKIPKIPSGKQISRIDVVLRLRSVKRACHP